MLFCSDRDSGDFLCVLFLVVLTAAVSSNFTHSMGADDRGMANAEKEEIDGKASTDGRASAKAVAIDGRKEWYCRFCSETNVWTRSKCRRCQTHIPFVLQGKYKEAVSTKACRSRSESSHWAKETELLELREENSSRKKEGHRRCSLKTLVKKARSQKMEK